MWNSKIELNQTFYPFRFALLLDKPGAPKSPTVSDILATEATIAWQPPEEDGGSPVLGYNVERCLATSSRWIKINKELIVDLNITDKVWILSKHVVWFNVFVNSVNILGF